MRGGGDWSCRAERDGAGAGVLLTRSHRRRSTHGSRARTLDGRLGALRHRHHSWWCASWVTTRMYAVVEALREYVTSAATLHQWWVYWALAAATTRR
jgi:hypothetical protein